MHFRSLGFSSNSNRITDKQHFVEDSVEMKYRCIITCAYESVGITAIRWLDMWKFESAYCATPPGILCHLFTWPSHEMQIDSNTCNLRSIIRNGKSGGEKCLQNFTHQRIIRSQLNMKRCADWRNVKRTKRNQNKMRKMCWKSAEINDSNGCKGNDRRGHYQ